jgi:hypothetical protein
VIERLDQCRDAVGVLLGHIEEVPDLAAHVVGGVTAMLEALSSSAISLADDRYAGSLFGETVERPRPPHTGVPPQSAAPRTLLWRGLFIPLVQRPSAPIRHR